MAPSGAAVASGKGYASRTSMHPPQDNLWWRFTATAFVWLIPALLLLPLVLIVAAITMVAADGSLLELGSGIRGKLLTALGPLLVVLGVGTIVFAAVAGADREGWINAGFFAAFLIALGVFAIRKALRYLAAQPAGSQ